MTEKTDPKTGEITDNLSLWNSLEKTNPQFTKQFRRGGGFSGTALNGMYVVKRLTEAFGPCGQGWKFVLESERIERGHTLKDGNVAQVHIVRGHIDYHDRTTIDPLYWYSTGPQFGQTMFVDENKNGTYTDEEAPKKSITDCLGKCAAQLGIGADIFLGFFDDNKYVNDRKREEAGNGHQAAATSNSRATDPIGDIEYARGAYTAIAQQIKQSTSVDDVDAVMTANTKQLEDIKRIAGEPHWQKLLDSAKERKEKLAKVEEPRP